MQYPDHKAVAEGIHKCIKNAEEFYEAARCLLRLSKERESYLLNLYAMEEIGKILLLFNLQFHTDSDEHYKLWQQRFKDHEEKFQFSDDFEDFMKGRYPLHAHKQEGADRRKKIAYVENEGNHFRAPDQVSLTDAKKLDKEVARRLAFLKEKHRSVESDIDSLKRAEPLKGLTKEELKKLFENRPIR